MSRQESPARRLLAATPAAPYLRYAARAGKYWVGRAGAHARSGVLNVLNGGAAAESLPIDLQWKKILAASTVQLPEAAAGARRILFATSYGFNAYVAALHSMLAASVQLRGAAASFLVSDAALPACEWNPYGNFEPDPGEHGPGGPPALNRWVCRWCTRSLVTVYERLGLPIHAFSAYRREGDLERFDAFIDAHGIDDWATLRYRGAGVGEQALASTLRSLMRGHLDHSDERHRWLFRRYLLGAITVAELTHRLLEDVEPDCVIAPHGIYVTHGIICDVARERGIDVVVHEWSDRQGTFILSHGETSHRELTAEPTEAWEQLELTPEREERLDRYLDSKRSSSMDWLCHHPNPIEDRETLMRELRLDPQRPMMALFTNVVWDAQIYYKDAAYSDMLDWLFDTIDYARERPDVQLVVRVHPGEVRIWGVTAQPVLGEIENRYGELPENIRVVPPGSDLSSYTLAELADVSLVYGTKLGLELAARGTPVIIAGGAFVRNKDVTYDAGSPAEYRALLDRAFELGPASEDRLARARRYAYHYYFRRVMEIPLIGVIDPRSSSGLHFRFGDLAELQQGRHEILDLICDGLMTGREFLLEAGAGAAT